MQRAYETTSNPRLMSMGRYLLARLQSESATKSMADAFEPVHARFAAALEALREAKFQRRVRAGALRAADDELDSLVSRLNTYALAAAENDRGSDLYRAFFPTGRIAETVDAPYAEAPHTRERLAAAASSYPNTVPSDLLVSIADTTDAVVAAIKELEIADAVVANASTDLVVSRLPWVRAYNRSHPQLQLLFPERTTFVESFYYKPNRRHDDVDDIDEVEDDDGLTPIEE